MTIVLAIALAVMIALTLGLAVGRRVKAESPEEFLVAGRRLSLPVTTATLFATWFGAGTMLTAADEVHASGLSAVALEPLGAGLCLILAGWAFAVPLWRMRLLTLADFFSRVFGSRAETMASVVMVPSYFGWIAVQFLALANLLEHFFALPQLAGVVFVCLVGMVYAWIGGMWSVAITDALLFILMITGSICLAVGIFIALDKSTFSELFSNHLGTLTSNSTDLLDNDHPKKVLSWIALLAVGSLGNIPGQDLSSRIFSARSETTAKYACYLAGMAYLIFGCAPVLAGLSAEHLLDTPPKEGVMLAITEALFSPAMTVVFVMTITATVLSTIDSAILSPATVIAQNLWRGPAENQITRTRISIVGVAGVSLVLALLGESAYALLESAYELGLTGLFIPLVFGLYLRPRGEMSALAAMGIGASSWALHEATGWDSFLQPLFMDTGWSIPTSLAGASLSALSYLLVGNISKTNRSTS